MNTYVPTRKMTTVGVAGSITVMVVWGLSYLGVQVPAEVSSAFTTMISFAGGWLVRDNPNG